MNPTRSHQTDEKRWTRSKFNSPKEGREIERAPHDPQIPNSGRVNGGGGQNWTREENGSSRESMPLHDSSYRHITMKSHRVHLIWSDTPHKRTRHHATIFNWINSRRLHGCERRKREKKENNYMRHFSYTLARVLWSPVIEFWPVRRWFPWRTFGADFRARDARIYTYCHRYTFFRTGKAGSGNPSCARFFAETASASDRVVLGDRPEAWIWEENAK